MISACSRLPSGRSWWSTAMPPPSPIATTTPHALVTEQAGRTPQAIAVRCGSQSLTYAALETAANRLAHRLIALGVGPEVPVALCVERSLDLLIGLLAIWKAGGAFLPLDPSMPSERLGYLLTDSGARVLVTQERLLAHLPQPQPPTLCLDREDDGNAGMPESAPPSQVTGANLAYLIYTSGSTGRPQGVLVPHRGLVNYLVWAEEVYGAAAGSGAPVFASLAADAVFPNLFLPLLAGRTVELLDEEQPLEALAERLPQAGYSLIKLTPSQLEVLDQLLLPQDGWVPTLVIGAEALRGDVVRPWQQQAPGTRLLNEYGPTETVVGCSLSALPSTPLEGAVPMGLPIANLTFYVLDAAMQPVPVGIPGGSIWGGWPGLGLSWPAGPDRCRLCAPSLCPHARCTPLSHGGHRPPPGRPCGTSGVPGTSRSSGEGPWLAGGAGGDPVPARRPSGGAGGGGDGPRGPVGLPSAGGLCGAR